MANWTHHDAFRATLAAGAILTAGICLAQQPAKFEAAAIKPGDKNHLGALVQRGPAGGQFRMTNVPLKQWVEMGLSVPDYALKAPSWLETTTFDLNAKLPTTLNQYSQAEMMKALLIERFGLKWHEEPGTASGYELVADKKVMLQPATLTERLLGSGGRSSGPTLVAGANMTMPQLAEMLGTVLGKPVIDATHISGGYDLRVQWRPDSDAQAAEQKRYGVDVDSLPGSVFTAVQEKLGLRLQPAKVPSKLIVVDHINNQPTEN
ncbi:MAG TPA: TIGR03435 family protein [Acidobacteriaceae bacterium]